MVDLGQGKDQEFLHGKQVGILYKMFLNENKKMHILVNV